MAHLDGIAAGSYDEGDAGSAESRGMVVSVCEHPLMSE